MEWFHQVKQESFESDVTLLMYDFLTTQEVEKALEEAIRSQLGVRQWKKVIMIGGREMSRIMKRRYSSSIWELARTIGERSFDEIFVACDRVGPGSALILNTYPNATRVVYGDSFGYVGYQGDIFPEWSFSLQSARLHLKALARKILFGTPKQFGFDAAVLTLPVDWSGEYLRNIPLIVPDKRYAARRLGDCCNQLPELSSYCDSLLEGTHNPHVVLLSNLSAARFMSPENEIELYLEMMREAVPTGATILLKVHPRGQKDILSAIVKGMGAKYHIRAINDPRFWRIPIELWAPLIERCRFVTVVSSSGLHLSYFYSAKVSVSLSDSAIMRYFYPEWVPYITKANAVIRESLHKLAEWDGTSVLWRAPEGTQ